MLLKNSFVAKGIVFRPFNSLPTENIFLTNVIFQNKK
jgi:hypothetical protein